MRDRIGKLFRRQPTAAASSPPAGAAGGEPGAALPPNKMLERIIAGRTVQAVAQDTTPASITFTDGSIMKIKTGAPLPAAALTGKTVKAVRQGGLRLELDFTDGSQAAIAVAEETSSVLLRDGKGNFEYAD